MIKKIFVLIFMLSFCTAYATPVDTIDNLSIDNIEVHSFESVTFKSLINDILSGNWNWDINKIISSGLKVLFNAVINNVSLVAVVLVVAILSSILLNLKTTLGSDVTEAAFYATYIIVAVLIAKGVGYALEYGAELTSQLDFYIKTIIPVVISVSVASGAVVSGAVVQPLIIGISQFIAFVVSQWLVPSLTVTCGMCIVNNISDKADLSGIIMLMQKAMRWTCGILMTVFVGIMTIQCMITPALDSVAGKVTRYAISNFVPVIGGLISESISIVAGYSSALKGAVGGAGIVVGVLMCVKPLAEVASVAILYNISSAVIRIVCDKRIASLIGSLGQIVTTLLILMIMITLMFVINICAAVNIGGFGGTV